MPRDRASFELFRLRAAGHAPSGAALARRIAAPLGAADLARVTDEELWAVHGQLMERHREAARRGEPPPEPGTDGAASLLDVKVELGQRLLGPCRVCWHRCPVDRRRGELGRCRLGPELRVYQDFVHLGEELELIPTHALFLAGCSYRCRGCSDHDHVARPEDDPVVAPEALARSIDARRAEGAASLSFIGGSPDVSLPGVLQALQRARASVPVVWNSNLSGTPEAHDLLEGTVDAWVADLKYGGEGCAQAGSRVEGSLAVAQRNLLRVREEAYLIVRHLVLPGHVDCCAIPVLDWLAEHLPGARVNLMDQYTPLPQARGTAWDRRPTAEELTLARAHASGLPLDLCGPGRVQGPAPTAPSAEQPAGAPTRIESQVTIGADGNVIIENLSPELAALVEKLTDLDPDLQARWEAGAPWRDDPARG